MTEGLDLPHGRDQTQTWTLQCDEPLTPDTIRFFNYSRFLTEKPLGYECIIIKYDWNLDDHNQLFKRSSYNKPKTIHVAKDFTCFLIDDDIDDQEIFLTVLEQVDPSIRCYTAINGQDAIHKLTSEEVKPDLIFLDLNMPLMNGKQFLIACSALERCKQIPVIILTTSSDKNSIEETRKLGARDYITKPDKFSAWGSIIKEKLNVFRPG